MKKAVLLSILIAVALVAAACTAGPNELRNTPNGDGEVAGFWQGIWQGVISPFTFLLSLFARNITVYEVHNNGAWYNFGFLMGASIIFGGSGGGAASRRKRRD